MTVAATVRAPSLAPVERVSPWLVGLGAAVSLVASVTAPLWTYGTTLALFGAVHVLSELRYLDRRFGVRLAAPMWTGIGLILSAIVLARIGPWLGWMGRPVAMNAELFAVVALCLLVVPWAARRSGATLPAALVAAGGLLIGVGISPVHTLLLLACLHNWTPVALIAEALDPPWRRRAMAWCAVLFGVIPLWIASGHPTRLAKSIGHWAPDASWLPTGPLADHLGAYLPRAWHGEPWAVHAFSALVFAQCLHYLAVIVVLPSLPAVQGPDPHTGQPRGRWIGRIPPPLFAGALIATIAVLGLAHYHDFAQARRAYGLLAAVHAWVEVPLLLAALSLPRGAP